MKTKFMSKGRKRKPYRLKLFEGNRGKRKLDKPPEPVKPLGPPPPSLDKVGADLWRLVSEWYASLGVIFDADSRQLEIFCRAFSEYKKYSGQIKRYGAWYSMPTGSIRLHPRVQMRDRAIAVIHKYGSELGFGPIARQKLTGINEGENDPLEKMFNKSK